ncbi:META domain-containing protein [Deinococcus malanensis]|uniref:META domain-containing protein n=1 Tax=Deinococcus malanensis TaxID=1706855 RepID=UPI003642380E
MAGPRRKRRCRSRCHLKTAVSGDLTAATGTGAYRLEGNRLVLTEAISTTLRACPEESGSVGLTELLAARPTVTATAARLTLAADGTILTFTLK